MGQISKWSQTSTEPWATIWTSFSPYLQTFSIWPQKSVASLTIKDLCKPLTTPISPSPQVYRQRGRSGLVQCSGIAWLCGAPAQAPSVAQQFANETEQLALNTGVGSALRMPYKILSHSSEMPWHRFTPRLHTQCNWLRISEKGLGKGRKKP